MVIRQTEVDGVPTLIAPSAGQMHAGLVFRVGRADETLARSGVTHLLEHLVLFPLGSTDYHFNGSTGPVTTSFHTAGSVDDVATFLTSVCDSLAALPFGRMETEKSIIRTEWSGRTPSIHESMPLWRYGAKGYGLVSYDEIGAQALTPYDVEDWARTWFTRENAVLWIAGHDVPPGLRLKLPSGQRWSVPRPASNLPVTPAYFCEGRQGVAMSAVVRRSAAASVYAEVLERNLYRDLRQEAGLSYTANASFEARGDGFGTVSAAADALAEKLPALVGGFIDTLAKLRVGRIDQADIHAHLTKINEAVGHPDAEASTLSSAAFELLTGRPVLSLEQRVAELNAVTVADVHAVAGEVMTTALLMTPQGTGADWAGFVHAPTQSDYTVQGRAYGSLETHERVLHIGGEGITSVDHGRPTTVRFDQVAAMMRWPDGARQLMGEDGFVVGVEPTFWNLDPGAIAAIDAAVHPASVISMPGRDPDAIPRPKRGNPAATGASATPPAASGRKSWTGWQLTGLIASLVLGTMFLCLAGGFTLAAGDDNGSKDDIGTSLPITTWVCTLIFFVPAAYLLIQRRRK
jgi:zinc protease